ncbi:GDNF/GAS1 domain protein [Ditylenchus destructor]|nr:GDNF/GAS1 domain protein [Ditylenchus destructor]
MDSLLRILVVLLAVAEDQESSHALQEHPNFIHDYYVQTPQKSTLHSCDDLCRLCSADTLGCARSMTELAKHCVMSSTFEGTDASCTGRRRHICTRHLSVVEHFLRSQNGFWCRISDKNSIIYHTQDLNDENSGHFLTACTDFLRTRNFWLGQNRAHCPAKPTQKIGVPQAVTTSSGLVRQSHRTTRSPANYYANASGNNNNNGYNAAVNNRIQKWKTELSSDLAEFSRVLPAVSCNSALHDLCLQHISCRELWKIFRQSCVVDAQNQCQMTNPNDCWQSFEGISWTGLGTCSCFDNNSDCHWIRLQTNYNKCIYELSLTMGSSSTLPLQDTQSVPSTTMTTPTPASSGEVLSTSPSTPKLEQNFGQKPLYYQNGRANVAQRNDRERENERRLQQEKDALELKRISEEKRRVQLQQQEQQRLYQQRLDEYRIKHEAARQQQEEQRRREMEDRRREHEDHQQALQQAQPEPTPWYERPLQPVHSRHTSREEWRRPQQYPQARSQTQRSNPSATSSSGSVIDYNVSSGRNQKYENKTGANANQVDIYTLGKQPTEAPNVEDGGGVYVLRIHATKTSRNGEESGTVSTPDTKQIWFVDLKV